MHARVNQTLSYWTSHKMPQLVTLFAASTVLVSVITVGASASESSGRAALLGPGVSERYQKSLATQLESSRIGTTALGPKVTLKHSRALTTDLVFGDLACTSGASLVALPISLLSYHYPASLWGERRELEARAPGIAGTQVFSDKVFLAMIRD